MSDLTNSGSETFVAQEGGDHYQVEYQHWDWVLEAEIGYLAGNATKYISRWRKKNGVQDLLKALSYIDKMIATRETSEWHYHPSHWKIRVLTDLFIESAGLTEEEGDIIHLLAGPCPLESLEYARGRLDKLLRRAQMAARAQALPLAPMPLATGASPALPLPCGGAGHAIGQGQGTSATAGSQVSGLTGMKHPFGYDGEDDGA
jgi:hypothetical protein